MKSLGVELLRCVRFVLVRTTHPGNIGSAARAMKNMGIDQLYLVQPKYFPHPDANALSSGAKGILEHAVVTNTLNDALAGCHLVVGTSARQRALTAKQITARECASKTLQHASLDQRIAIVFGQERTGLANEELDLCQFHLTIPAQPNFNSLNLAQAVQIVAYELWVAASEAESVPLTNSIGDLATAEEVELFYNHLEETLARIGFLDAANPRQLLRKLRRLYNRAQLEASEVNILRGILRATLDSID